MDERVLVTGCMLIVLKAESIIEKHSEERAMARFNDPQRFACQPVIGELAVRHAADHSDQQLQLSHDTAAAGQLHNYHCQQTQCLSLC